MSQPSLDEQLKAAEILKISAEVDRTKNESAMKVAEILKINAEADRIKNEVSTKAAEISKINAEAERIKNEAVQLLQIQRDAFWERVAKIIGYVILGIGGFVTGLTQYQTNLANINTLKAETKLIQLEGQIAMVETENAKKLKEEANKLKKQVDADLETAKKELIKTNAEQKRLIQVQQKLTEVQQKLVNEQDRLRRERDRLVDEINDRVKSLQISGANLNPFEIAVSQIPEMENFNIISRNEIEAGVNQIRNPELIFVHFGGTFSISSAKKFQQRMSELGYVVPGIQEIKRDSYKPEIRYFSQSNSSKAQKLLSATLRFLSQNNCNTKLEAVYVRGYDQSSPLEVWLPRDCK